MTEHRVVCKAEDHVPKDETGLPVTYHQLAHLYVALTQEKAALEDVLADQARLLSTFRDEKHKEFAELEARERALVEALNKASCIESKHFPDHWCCVSCGAWYDYATKECLGHTEGCYVAAALTNVTSPESAAIVIWQQRDNYARGTLLKVDTKSGTVAEVAIPTLSFTPRVAP